VYGILGYHGAGLISMFHERKLPVKAYCAIHFCKTLRLVTSVSVIFALASYYTRVCEFSMWWVPPSTMFCNWIDVSQFLRLCLASRFLSVERAWSFQPASWQFARSQLHHGIRPSRRDTAMRSDSLPPPKTLLRRPSPTICPGEVLLFSQAKCALCGAAWWFYCWSGKRHSMATEVWHVCLSVLLTFNDLYCRVYVCWGRSRVNPVVHLTVRVLCQLQ